MARLAQNNYYVTIDGVNVSPHTGEISMDTSVESIDITAGAGKTHVEMSGGLRSSKFKLTLAYDDTLLVNYVAKMVPGQVYALVVGPEGATTGKPKHDQSVLLTGTTGPKVDVKKGFTTFELSFEGAAAPTTDFYNGGTFA